MKRTVSVFCAIFLYAVSDMFAADTLRVGPGRALTTPSAAAAVAKDGDTIEIDAGLYAADVVSWWQNDLVLRGVGGRAHLRADGANAAGKGIWVIQGRNTVVENIEFSGATVPDQNGAGIRQEGANLTVRNCYFHDNENGILGPNDGGEILIEYSEFANNGFGDGFSHNMYILDADKFTLRYSYVHHAKIGHNVKSRARVNFILYNRIMDEAEGNSSYAIDIPDAGSTFVIGNLIQQGPNTDNRTMLSYGAEGTANPSRNLYVVNNTFVNDRGSGNFVFVNGAADSVRLINNIFMGTGTVLDGPGESVSNLVTEDARLAGRQQFDYRLLPDSPAIDKGSDPGEVSGVSLMPASQYVHPASEASRRREGALDIGAMEFAGVSTRVGERGAPLPEEATLHQNYPNPFNPETVVSFSQVSPGPVSLKVFTLTGALVAVLADGYFDSGAHKLRWRPANAAAGIYIYQLETRQRVQRRKLLYIK